MIEWLAQKSKLSLWSPTCSSMETSFCSPVQIKPKRVCKYSARSEVTGECYRTETNDIDFAKALFCFSETDEMSFEKEEIICNFEIKGKPTIFRESQTMFHEKKFGVMVDIITYTESNTN